MHGAIIMIDSRKRKL